MFQKTLLYFCCLNCFFFSGCKEEVFVFSLPQDRELVWSEYNLLPEALITADADSNWLATYINPTDRYGHAILGDGIEAGGVVLYNNGAYYEYLLPEDAVFEDLYPRFIDVNTDGIPELLCIKSGLSTGASLVIYQLVDGEIREYAHIAPIGHANSWLNVVAVHDLDVDGNLDLVWIQTPHVGGILKSAHIAPGLMPVLDQYRGVSNHALDERNLCLSAIVEQSGVLEIVVPAQARDSLLFFEYSEGFFTRARTVPLMVDFSRSLTDQLIGEEIIQDCLGP